MKEYSNKNFKINTINKNIIDIKNNIQSLINILIWLAVFVGAILLYNFW